MRIPVLLLTVGVLISALPVLAHDLWIEPDDSGFTLRRGHTHSDHTHSDQSPSNHTDSHHGIGGADELSYPATEVLCVAFRDATGNAVPCHEPAVVPITFVRDSEAAFGLLRSGPWTQTPSGTRNQARSEVQHPLRSWMAYESAKFVACWREGAGPLTDHLELTPLNNPGGLKPGDKIRLRLTRDGQPVAE
ncbi:MAG: hypothetical protein ABIF77_03450, partial [bacterium]